MNFEDYRIVHGSEINALVTQLTSLAKNDGECNEDALKRYAKKLNGIVVHVDDKDFWPDRAYRDYWTFDLKAKKIKINLKKIKDDLLDSVRAKRNRRLSELDQESMRAIEDGDINKIQAVKKRKEELRNLPPEIEKRLDKILNSKKREKTKLKELRDFKIPELEI